MSRLANRLKLTDKQISEIMHVFANEDYSRLKLAKQYNTSIYAIDLLLNIYESKRYQKELKYG